MVWISKWFKYLDPKKIKYIDGYKINLINFEKDKIDKKQLVKKISPNPIYGLSILGYHPTSLQEHKFGLFTTLSKLKANFIAKSKCLFGCKKKQKIILLL